MKLTVRSAPHIRSFKTSRGMMADVVISLLALYFIAYFYYGIRVLVLGAYSVLLSWVLDTLCVFLATKRFRLRDISSLVTGMLIPLMLPVTVSYWVVTAAVIFAICVIKHPFGGLGHNIFNPAAGGIAFAIACWGSDLFLYPSVFTKVPVFGEYTAALTVSGAHRLFLGGVPTTDVNSLFLGLMPGPMGTTNILVVAACLIYLAFRGNIRITQPFFCLLTAALFAFAFPRIGVSRLESVLYELLCTPVVFGATFLLNDPVTSPKRPLARVAYGVCTGLVMMLFQWFGAYEQTLCFALLLMNAAVPFFNRLFERYYVAKRRKEYARQTSESTES